MFFCITVVVYLLCTTDGASTAKYLEVYNDEELKELCTFFQNQKHEVAVIDPKRPNNIKVAQTDTQFDTGAFSMFYIYSGEEYSGKRDLYSERARKYFETVQARGKEFSWQEGDNFDATDPNNVFVLEFTVTENLL